MTVDGQKLNGYVMNEDAYVLWIFVGKDEFGFSRNRGQYDANAEDLANLKAKLSNSTSDIFPVKYETDFLDSQDNLITGVFSLPSEFD